MEKETGPRFHQKTVIPKVPEGMELVKFHGQPALIPIEMEGESMYGRTRFTVRQAEALIQLERERQLKEMLRHLDDYQHSGQHVICRIAESMGI